MPCWIGYQNRALSASLSANFQVASLPAQNLQNPHGDPGNAWQTPPGTAGGNITINAGDPNAIWQIFAIARTNLTEAAVVRWRVGSEAALNDAEPLAYDSGTVSPGVAPGYGQSVHIAPQPVMGQFCRLSILNASNPDGFVSVALLFAGIGAQLGGISYQSTWQRTPQQSRTETRGGQQYITPRFTRRGWDASFPYVPNSMVYAAASEAMMAAERGENVLFVPFDGSSDIQRDAVYGLMEPQPVGYLNAAGLRRTWRATFTERL